MPLIAVVTPLFPIKEEPYRGNAIYQTVVNMQRHADIEVICPVAVYPPLLRPPVPIPPGGSKLSPGGCQHPVYRVSGRSGSQPALEWRALCAPDPARFAEAESRSDPELLALPGRLQLRPDRPPARQAGNRSLPRIRSAAHRRSHHPPAGAPHGQRGRFRADRQRGPAEPGRPDGCAFPSDALHSQRMPPYRLPLRRTRSGARAAGNRARPEGHPLRGLAGALQGRARAAARLSGAGGGRSGAAPGLRGRGRLPAEDPGVYPGGGSRGPGPAARAQRSANRWPPG